MNCKLLHFIILFMLCSGADAGELSWFNKSLRQSQLNFTKNQNEIVTGKVTDTEGVGIPGVSVIIKSTGKGAITDTQGRYSIRVDNANTILVFSYIGYTTIEKRVGTDKVINIMFSELATNLDEVVVVGYGTQKRSEVTGSVGSIKADQIDQFSGGSVITSLQGKIAGLQITTDSGEPGAGANITLRGVSSINGSSAPLYIIDGVPVNNDSFTSLEDNATFSPLNDINPADIESVEVLKDAATASIYGSRASNGVIIITTKAGKNKEPQINASINSSLVDITRKIGMLNGPQFRDAYIESYYNLNGTMTPKVSIIDSLNPLYKDSYNWQDIMYRQAVQYKADLSVSGASKDKEINYFVSVGYRDLKPVIVNTKYTQNFANAKLNYNVSKRIKGSTNFNLSSYNYNRLSTGNTTASIVYRYLATLPILGPYDPFTGELLPLIDGTKINPLAQSVYTKNEIDRLRLRGAQELNFNILKGLDFKTTLSVDYNNTETSFFQPPILSSSNSGKAIYSIYSPAKSNSFVNENTLTYQKKIKKHSFNFLLGQSFQENQETKTVIRGLGSIDNVITTIGGAASVSTHSQSIQKYLLSSYFTRLNYNYKSKYLLSALIRRDGSSRFGRDKRNAYFPSASAGWRFSQEKFIKPLTFLYDGKLRASYGITGNQNIGNYSSLGTYENAVSSYLGGVVIQSNNLPNPNLKWETTRQLDIGTDLSFFKGKLNITADYYIKNTSDLLFNVQVPSQTGFNTIPYNYGSLSNKGFDFQVEANIISKNKLKWNASFTFGLNRNKVTELPDNEDYFSTPFSLARVGQPVGVFYGFKSLGVYARDEDNVYTIDGSGNPVPYRKGSSTGSVYMGGDVIYEDVNKDGIINDDDLQIIGNPTPRFFGGVQNTFIYKNLTLGVFINYVTGNDIFNNLILTIDKNSVESNYSSNILRRWRNQGDVTDVPKVIRGGDPMQNYAVSSRFIEDGSFIRLQNLSLNYKIPAKYIKFLHIKGAGIGASVQNLITLGSYSGYDPEVSGGASPFGFGVDNGAFPKSRSYNFSFNVKL